MTLIELLAAISIVGVLSGIVITVSNQVRESATTTEETSAARQAITTYLLTPMDYDGYFMPGYKSVMGKTFLDDNGHRIPNAAEDGKRFPWRLAQFLEGGLSALYVGSHQEFYDNDPSTYELSLYPSLGMNSLFVGGHYDGTRSSPGYEPGPRSNNQKYPRDFWVLQPGDAHAPSKLIVFVSTHSVSDSFAGGVGFFRANPPKSPLQPNWGSYNEDIPASLGNVHLRHQGKATVANLDGSVELLNEEELRDMRRWSNQAAKYNDPDFSNWSRQ